MSFISRGFQRRSVEPEPAGRVPPGQHVTSDFPVLSAGPTPHRELEDWSFALGGEVDEALSWTWDEFQALPSEHVTKDIHCVTSWSKLDTNWEGVSVDTLLEGVETSAEFVVAYSDGGYTTNLPLEDVTGGKAWVAFGYDGAPLAPEHGGPARLLVPHLYFWKSAKWVRGLRLRAGGRAGLLGGLRLPQLRRPVARAALQRRLSWQVAEVVESVAETRARPQHGPEGARLGGPPGGSARRRPAHGRGRLPGGAQLLDRVGARRRHAGPDDRATGGRRGVAVPGRRAAARRQARAARPDRRLLRVGRRPWAARCCSSGAARGSSR